MMMVVVVVLTKHIRVQQTQHNQKMSRLRHCLKLGKSNVIIKSLHVTLINVVITQCVPVYSRCVFIGCASKHNTDALLRHNIVLHKLKPKLSQVNDVNFL